MHHPELPVATALASVLILAPLPSQSRTRVRSVAILILIVGTFLVNVICLVNSLVWAGNVRDVAPVWCLISGFFN
jgi:pheromone a factor receptor